MHNSATRQQAIKRHLRRIDAQILKLQAKRERFAAYRPLIFFSGIALTYWLRWTPLILALLIIGVEATYYYAIGKIIRRRQLWRDIKATQAARIALDWPQIPAPAHSSADETHPFEIDLDVSGPRSLHHLLDMAVSHGGSERLREWLLQPCPVRDVIQARQQLIRELAPLSRFRDKLLLHFRLISQENLDSAKLLRWLQTPSAADPRQKAGTSNSSENPSPTLSKGAVASPLARRGAEVFGLNSPVLRWALPVSAGLAVVNLLLLGGFALHWIPGYWVLSLAAYLAVYFISTPTIQTYFDALMRLYDELAKFKTILRYLERYPYNNHPHLKRLCEPFYRPEQLPSALLKRITRLSAATELRRNPLVSLFLNLLMPWDIYFARRVERCRRQCAEIFPEWVETWSELEALASLANFAYLHPEYAFPELQSGGQSAFEFQAIGLGHPLLPSAQKVCNDFRLNAQSEITLLTGSNMAGKSTFLKTLGLNLCLAYAGGPVNAVSLQTRLFRLVTCIQIHDSVTDGFSFFYAEVKRLKMILDALRAESELPAFFLIDEIFKGTNSRERLIGGRAYIQHLARQTGAGLIATHDLELGQLAEKISGLRNMHFRDDVADGKMIFDYKLRAGVCPTTNALKIMQMEGLPIDA